MMNPIHFSKGWRTWLIPQGKKLDCGYAMFCCYTAACVANLSSKNTVIPHRSHATPLSGSSGDSRGSYICRTDQTSKQSELHRKRRCFTYFAIAMLVTVPIAVSHVRGSLCLNLIKVKVYCISSAARDGVPTAYNDTSRKAFERTRG